MSGDTAHNGPSGKAAAAPPEPALLEYSDRPPGSRLEVTRDGGQVVIVDPPSGFRRTAVEMLLPMLTYLALLIAIAMLLLHKFLPAFGPAGAWRIMLRMFTPDAELLAAFALVGVVGYLLGRRRLTLTLTADRLIATTCIALWGRRWWSSRREIARRDILAVRASRFGSHVTLTQRAPAKPRSLGWAIFAGRADAKWIVRTLRHELGIERDGSDSTIGGSTNRTERTC
jgi:hypothetical protein